MKNKMSSEEYFFRYAFPCAYLKVERNKISKEEYTALESEFLRRTAPSKKTLEKVFSPAFDSIKTLAKRMKKDYWSLGIMRAYWETEHNEIISRGEGEYAKAPEFLKELCKIQVAEVTRKVEVDGKSMLIVNYSSKGKKAERAVFDFLVSDSGIKKGDKVKIHYAYAIEKVD